MFFTMPEDFTSLKKYPVYTLKIYPSVQSFPFHKQPPGSFPTLLIVCRCWQYNLQRFRLWCIYMKLSCPFYNEQQLRLKSTTLSFKLLSLRPPSFLTTLLKKSSLHTLVGPKHTHACMHIHTCMCRCVYMQI